MEKFLGQLLEKFLGDVEFEVPVAFDKEVHSVLGLFAIGRNVASFIVCNGKVDLHDLPEIAADVPLANLVLKSLHVPALSDTIPPTSPPGLGCRSFFVVVVAAVVGYSWSCP